MIFTVLFGFICVFIFVMFLQTEWNLTCRFLQMLPYNPGIKKMHWLHLGIILYHHSALKYIRKYVAALKVFKSMYAVATTKYGKTPFRLPFLQLRIHIFAVVHYQISFVYRLNTVCCS
jgi:hypothetical protein